jgi:ribonuclease HI
MPLPKPHFLLMAEGKAEGRLGCWRFSLEAAGMKQLEVDDFEPFTQGQRLELLAVVRGLEALEQPSLVTLVTPSRYVKRGIVYGIEDWRSNGWYWESHGKMVPVKNGDLWRRVDQALQVHEVECRLQMVKAEGGNCGEIGVRKSEVGTPRRWLIAAFRRRVREFGAALRFRLATFGTGLLPRPWFD